MKFTIETSKSKEEVLRIIKENTHTRTSIFDFKGNSGKFFEGKVFEDSFSLLRIIHYRNDILPVIKGNIEEIEGGCRVNIKMRMPIFAIIFFSIWLPGGILGSILILLAASVPEQTDFISFFITLIGFPLFALIFFLMYKYEAKKSKEKLEELLNYGLII